MKKSIAGVMTGLLGALIGVGVTGYFSGKTIEQKSRKVDKFKGYYYTLNQWMLLKQRGESLEKYFTDNKIFTIAIYGMGEMGNRLYDELKNTNIKVKYAIDKNADNTYAKLNVVDLEDDLEKVDAIVVTSIFAFDSIKEDLKGKLDCPIISLEDIVYEL